MKKEIEELLSQCSWEPRIDDSSQFVQSRKSIIVGMGGSNLVADLLKARDPFLDIVVHRDYDLPPMTEEELRSRLIILSSYSGNTEEVLSAFHAAGKRKLNRFVIAAGGELMSLAKKESIPHITLPNTGVQPRAAIIWSLRALLKMLGDEEGLAKLRAVGDTIKASACMRKGRAIAQQLLGRIPVFYASARNRGIAYIWKIQLNETAKIPAFFNVFPEENHNEFMGFSGNGATNLSRQFIFFLMSDNTDDSHIRKRMDVFERLYKKQKLAVQRLPLEGTDPFQKIISSLAVSVATALSMAAANDIDPYDSAAIEEFKKQMRD